MKKKVLHNSVPQSVEEAFAILDGMLSDNDKNAILDHFTLGLWIRNNWIHTRKPEEYNSLLSDLFNKKASDYELLYGYKECDLILPKYFFYLACPDEISGDILELYVEHLSI